MNTRYNFPTDPMAYTGYKRPSNLFPESFAINTKYRRTSWEIDKYVYLSDSELVWSGLKTRYIPTEEDVESTDWEVTQSDLKVIPDTVIVPQP